MAAAERHAASLGIVAVSRMAVEDEVKLLAEAAAKAAAAAAAAASTSRRIKKRPRPAEKAAEVRA